ncbi:hypothetical protein [Sandaracinobacteroides sayramensis]|nr:hypothetical protein [Sandaracinobacteroides sayramensis]
MSFETSRPATAGQRRNTLINLTRKANPPLLSRIELRRLVAEMVD